MTNPETPNPANGGANAPAGGSAAGADFDALLREFTDATKPNAQPSADVGKVLETLKPVIAFASTELSTRHRAQTQKDIDAAISFVKDAEDGIKDIPPKIVRGMLEGYASEHEDFAQAFQNRGKDGANWQAALAKAKAAVVEDLRGLSPSTRVVSDVAAATAAVRGSVSAPPPRDGQPSAQQMFSMSQRDFQALIDTELAKANR